MSKAKVLLFGGPECVLCQGWKRKLEHLGIEHEYFDTSTREGLAEMAYRNCARIPALVIGEKRFEEVNPARLTTSEIRELVDKL